MQWAKKKNNNDFQRDLVFQATCRTQYDGVHIWGKLPALRTSFSRLPFPDGKYFA